VVGENIFGPDKVLNMIEPVGAPSEGQLLEDYDFIELELEKIVDFDNAYCFDYLFHRLNIPKLLSTARSVKSVELPVKIKSYKVTSESMPKLMQTFNRVRLLKKTKNRDVWIRLLRYCFVVAKAGSSLYDYSRGEEFKSRLEKNRFAIRFVDELLKRKLIKVNDRNLFEHTRWLAFKGAPHGRKKWQYHRRIYREVFPKIKIIPNFLLLEELGIYAHDEWKGVLRIEVQERVNVNIRFGKKRLVLGRRFERKIDEKIAEAIGFKLQRCFQYFEFSRWAQYLEKNLQTILGLKRTSLESMVFNISKLVPLPPQIEWLVEFNLKRKHFTKDMSQQLKLLEEVETHASELENLPKIIENYLYNVKNRYNV